MEATYKIYSENPKEDNTYPGRKTLKLILKKLKFESVGWVHVYCEVISGGLL
jgi:hypothetical protein